MNDSEHELVGEQVMICHSKGKIIEYVDERAFQVSIEIGGVHQHITITEDYAEAQVVN